MTSAGISIRRSGRRPRASIRSTTNCRKPSRRRTEKQEVDVVRRLDIQSKEGSLDCYTFLPTAAGAWPVVVMYMDAFGIRPQLFEMAERLPSSGHLWALSTP